MYDLGSVFEDYVVWERRGDFRGESAPPEHKPELSIVELVSHQLPDNVVRMVAIYVKAKLFGHVEERACEPAGRGEKGLLGYSVHGVTV